MTAKTVFQYQTGSGALWGSTPSTGIPLGIWEPGFALTPIEFEPDSTGAVEPLVLGGQPEHELEVVLEKPPEEDWESPALLSARTDPILKELWDNPDDADYDRGPPG